MIADRYELEEEIGRGGMGAVWRGRDTRLGRIVALKRLGEVGTADGPGRERAHREALLAAQLNHAHIVSVHDLVEDDEGWTWLVMEHVPGITLSQAIAKGSLQTEAIARIGRQVAEALAAAHAAGISHRDVKPSNILLTEDGTAKLSDFGIARGENDAAITRTGQVTGSPAYLPPEVARGANGGPAGDMWSLGATLFHAAAGHTPYAGEGDGVAVLFRIVHEAPPRLTDRGDLTAVVAHLMTPEPEGRPDAASAAIALAVIAGDSRAEATQAISPLAGGPVPDPEATSLIAAAPAAVDSPTQAHRVVDPEPPADRDRKSSKPWIIAAAVAAVLLLGGALAIGLGGGDDDSGDSGSLTSQELDAFGREFVETAASDPDAAFEMMTPEAQAAVGGIEGFRDAWEPAEGAAVTQVVSDTAAETVSVACEWTVTTSRSSFVLPSTTTDEAVEPPVPTPSATTTQPTPAPTPSQTPTPTPTPTATPTPTPTPEEEEPEPEPETQTVARTVTLHVVRDGDRLVVDQYSQR